MYQWRPAQWLKYAPLTVLPFLVSTFVQTDGLVNDVTTRAQAAIGQGAVIKLDGRDAVITGEVKSKAALTEAVNAALQTYGVRTVDVSGVKVLPLAAPLIESLSTNMGQPEIKGTWPQDVAKTLKVTVNEKAYEFGKDAELQSTGGAFILKPAAAIADGTYDVVAEVSDGESPAVAAVVPGKLVIDTVAPAAPAMTMPAVGAVWPFAVSGTWPEGDATGLKVKLQDKTYELGSDALKSDGKGNFTFDPRVDLAPGTYDLNFSMADAVGNQTNFDAKAAIVVPEPAPAPVVPGVLAAPTIAAIDAGNQSAPMLSGTYPAEAAKLAVTVGGKTFALNADKELTVDGAGNWMLMPAPLADGDYAVGVKVEDAESKISAMAVSRNLSIDTTAPAAPTVNAPAADAVWPYAITGTWPEGDSQVLSASLAGKAYAVNKDKELISDGKGNFTFMPSTVLAPGSYNIDFTVIDAVGNIRNSVARAAVVIPEEMKAPEPVKVAEPAPAPAPIVLVAPTIDAVTSDTDVPTVKGTWTFVPGTSLKVTLDGQAYKLGTDYNNLLSDTAGHWSLKPAKPLANGTYDVVAEVSDGAGQVAVDASVGEVVVNVAPPPPPAPVVEPLVAPTVEAVVSDSDHPTVKGTWVPRAGESLTVTLDGTSYKLGTDYDLLSNPAGNWTLKPKAALVNGTYDVIAQVALGDMKAMDATTGELQVNVAPPPPPPPANQPYDCVATMARISAVFPVRFEFNHDDLASPYSLSVNQYAALLKDARCLSMKVQVAGHADFKGSEAYNQGLSERRAKTVIDALVAGGIDAGRLTGVGYSKDKPLDPALTDSARMKNRRVEFTVLN